MLRLAAISMLLLTVAAQGQKAPTTNLESGCDPVNDRLVLAAPPTGELQTSPPGKALIYIVDADPDRWALTLHVCVDDHWVAALRGRMEFPLTVDPGDHSVSVAMQHWSHHPGAQIDVDPVASLNVRVNPSETVYAAIGVQKSDENMCDYCFRNLLK